MAEIVSKNWEEAGGEGEVKGEGQAGVGGRIILD